MDATSDMLSVELFNSCINEELNNEIEDGAESSSTSSGSKTTTAKSKNFDEKIVIDEKQLMNNIISILSPKSTYKSDKSLDTTENFNFLVLPEIASEVKLCGLVSHLARLDDQLLRSLTRKVIADTSNWLSTLFRFPKSTAYFHVKEVDGLIGACRMALHKKYPSYALNGFHIWTESSSNVEGDSGSESGDQSKNEQEDHNETTSSVVQQLPVIYISQCAAPGWADTCLRQLGLPSECLFTLKCNTTTDGFEDEEEKKGSGAAKGKTPVINNSDTIDIAFFENAIEEHIANNMTPMFLLAHAGTWLMGHTDNFLSLSAICAKYDIWLHVVGSNLAALGISGSASSIPESVSIISKTADSIMLQPREWLGISTAPRVTLYKDSDPALIAPAGLIVGYDYTDLNIIPLWARLQLMGPEKISSMLHSNANLAQQFSYKINNIPQFYSMNQSVSLSSVVLFQFSVKCANEFSKPKNTVLPPMQKHDCTKQDAINVWLCRKLRLEEPHVVLDLVQISDQMYLRFSPNLSASLRGTSSDHINELSSKLKKLGNTISETMAKTKEITRILTDNSATATQYPGVYLVPCFEWAGLAVLRYVPEYCEKPVIEGIVVPDQEERAIEEIERVNKLLLQQLTKSYPQICFTEGVVDKHWAIKVSMVSFLFDCEAFLTEFMNIGKKLEDSSSFIAGLGTVVDSMIRAANEQLLEEQSSQFWQEGLVRHIPIFGGIYSWMLPPAASPVKGRSFNLASGSLESTEFVYQHKLQYQSEHQKDPQKEPSETKA